MCFILLDLGRFSTRNFFSKGLLFALRCMSHGHMTQCRRKQICIGGGGLNNGLESGSNEPALVSEH